LHSRVIALHVRRTGYVVLCGFFCALMACGDTADRSGTQDTAFAPIREPNIVATAAAIGDTVVGAGRLRWSASRVAERLRSAGFSPVPGGNVTQPFMNVSGTIYQVDGAIVQAYIYGDAIAVARDTDRLDSATVAPPDMIVSWLIPPSLVVDNNLAAIILTRSGDTRRRIRAALTAEGDSIREP